MLERSKTGSLGSPETLVGLRLIDRYRIESFIGQGGMSVVFRGMDERLRRPVAIKVFSISGFDQNRLPERHFVQEAFALSQLRHPNTIRIFDVGAFTLGDVETPFQVAEYMEDGTLTVRVRDQGPLPSEAARRILEALAGALGEAHALEIIHRDVKPCNILFGRAGRRRIVKLADFGVALAKARIATAHDDTTLATTGSFFSLGWSAPEQLRGLPVDRTADVYSLGLVLGFMLAGERLRRLSPRLDLSGSLETLDQELAAAIAGQPALQGAVGEVILRACQVRPGARYQTVEELADDADRALAGRGARRSAAGEGISAPRSPHAPPASPAPHASPAPRAPPAPHAPPAPSAPPTEDREVIARDDTPPARRPVLVIDRLLPGLLVAGGHRLRVIEMATELDLELPADAGRRPFRLRARMLPAIGPVTHMHLRGLNCFLVRGQQPPTGGLDFSSSDSVRLLTSDRRSSLSIEVALGVRDGDRWRLMLPGTQLTLPVDQATDLAIITSASVDELVLIHRNQE